MVEAGDTNPNTFNISFDETEYTNRFMRIWYVKTNAAQASYGRKPTTNWPMLLDMMDTPSGDGINTLRCFQSYP